MKVFVDKLRSSLPVAFRLILFALAYSVAEWFGQLLSTTTHDDAPIWPAAGVGIAGVILGGYRMWPGIALGALLVQFQGPGHFDWSFLFTAAGSILEALAGGWLFHWIQ